jgi:hypothetical protein
VDPHFRREHHTADDRGPCPHYPLRRVTAQGERSLAWTEAATFSGVTYDLNRSYTDRDGDVWFFEDTISAEDGTWDMSSSADCYKNSLADVVLNWGPLKPHGRRSHDCATEEPTGDER